MEPTPIVPPVVIPSNKKMTKIIIAILVLILIVIAFTMLKKTEAPSDINNPNLQNLIASQEESKQLTEDINSATTFDNESSLAEIDSQFQ